MAGNKQPNEDTGLENLSVNSSRRSGTKEDGTESAAHQNGKHDPTESAKVPDQQIPVEHEGGFVHDAEVSEVLVAYEPVETAFPLHTGMVRKFFQQPL